MTGDRDFKIISYTATGLGDDLHIEIQNSSCLIVNYYARETNRLKAFDDLITALNTLTTEATLNSCLGVTGILYLTCILTLLEAVLSSNPKCLNPSWSIMTLLNNVWRVRNPSLRQFSWKFSNPGSRRLYYLLISNEVQYDITACRILAPLQYDHSPVNIKFHSPEVGENIIANSFPD